MARLSPFQPQPPLPAPPVAMLSRSAEWRAPTWSRSSAEQRTLRFLRRHNDQRRTRRHSQLIYLDGPRLVSRLGCTHILKEVPFAWNAAEVPTLRFLSDRCAAVPAPRLVAEWHEGGGGSGCGGGGDGISAVYSAPSRHYVLQSRVPGRTLQASWYELTAAQRAHVAAQVGAALTLLRKHTCVRMQSVDGRPLRGHGLLIPHRRRDLGLWHGAVQIWAAMREQLKRAGVRDAGLLAVLEEAMPPIGPGRGGEPFVLCHGDLTACNIMQEGGELTGIIDWEWAGYMPAWWEYARNGHRASWVDAQWKALLDGLIRPATPSAARARMWWGACLQLIGDPRSECGLRPAARGRASELERALGAAGRGV